MTSRNVVVRARGARSRRPWSCRFHRCAPRSTGRSAVELSTVMPDTTLGGWRNLPTTIRRAMPATAATTYHGDTPRVRASASPMGRGSISLFCHLLSHLCSLVAEPRWPACDQTIEATGRGGDRPRCGEANKLWDSSTTWTSAKPRRPTHTTANAATTARRINRGDRVRGVASASRRSWSTACVTAPASEVPPTVIGVFHRARELSPEEMSRPRGKRDRDQPEGEEERGARPARHGARNASATWLAANPDVRSQIWWNSLVLNTRLC